MGSGVLRGWESRLVGRGRRLQHHASDPVRAAEWSVVPGMTGNLTASPAGATHLFTGSSTNVAAGGLSGNFSVLAYFEDTNYINLKTDFFGTSLPAVFDGWIKLFKSA